MADDLSDFDRSPANPAGRKPAGGGRVAGSVRPPPPKLRPLRAGSASPAVGAGDAVGALFHRALALCFFAAFASLFVQVDLLLGPDGLLPVAAHVERLVKTGHGFLEWPSWLYFLPEARLTVGCVVGMVLAGLGVLGLAPRLMLLGLMPLYLGYVTAGRELFAFQWDSLLLEAALIGLLVPPDTRAPVGHLALKALLFKLYFESGLAKLQSAHGDWVDGSAMTDCRSPEGTGRRLQRVRMGVSRRTRSVSRPRRSQGEGDGGTCPLGAHAAATAPDRRRRQYCSSWIHSGSALHPSDVPTAASNAAFG